MSSALRDWSGVLALVAIAGLVLARSGDLAPMIELARQSREAVRGDADFLRTPFVLGPESPILDALERDHPAGTPVAVEGGGELVARAQRFWLALLPRYPIAEDAALRICPAPCAESGDERLARGEQFELIRRARGE